MRARLRSVQLVTIVWWFGLWILREESDNKSYWNVRDERVELKKKKKNNGKEKYLVEF